MTWRTTGLTVADVPEASPRELVVGSRTLALVRAGEELYALDGICPHQGGPLTDGTVEQGRLVCPLHGAAFAIESGAVVADPFGIEPPEGAVAAVRAFPARVVGGRVEVDVPDDPPG
jgi:nitrite reductase/ring-hydroxylating ferredoxin subunit